jgi:YD repeat-containing protein
MGYSARGAAALITVYNQRELPAELLFHDAQGRLLSRVVFHYDPAGHLVEEALTKMEDALPPELAARLRAGQLAALHNLMGGTGPIRQLHRYDEQGRRCETLSQMGPLGENRRTMAYNEHGEQIAEIAEHATREYKMDDEGRLSDKPARESVNRSEGRFRYQYDARGNWVEKITQGRRRRSGGDLRRQ